MRTIDADAILKRAEESFKNAGLHGEDYRKFKKWLRIAPTIDAVEVVRCKDCKYWHSNTEFCDVWSHMNIAQRTLVDDYCSLGERKET